MKSSISCLFISIVCLTLFTGGAYSQTELKSDTIPYEQVDEKMILTVKIGGKPMRFIFDTGGRNLITSDLAKGLNIKILGSELVADVNSKSSSMYRGQLPDMEIGNNIKMENIPFLVTSPNNYFRKLNVAGLLSGEAFSQICVSIHSREKYLILTYPFRPKGISRKDGIKMNLDAYYQPVVPLRIGNTTVNFLFDTGMGGFIHLSGSDYEKIKREPEVKVRATGKGFLHVGIGGIKNVTRKEFAKLSIDTMCIKDKMFTNIGTVTRDGDGAESIIGSEISEYGDIMLDFPRGLFYFFPFAEGKTDMDIATKVWNAKILPMNTHFEITGVIGDVDFKEGECVWDINGVDLSTIPPTESVINEIMDGIATDTAYLLIGPSKDKTKKVIIKKI